MTSIADIAFRSVRCSWRRSWCHGIVAALLCLGLFVAPVAAQSANEILVPPITSREFTRYARMMRLDHAQLIAAEAAHEDYKDQYRVLREREVRDFMKVMREVEASDNGGMPSRDVIERVLRERRNVRDRFRALDQQLFAALDPIVREDQRPRLARVMKLREREYFTIGAQMQQTQTIELLDLIERLDLPADVEAQVDPLLVAWENSYTAKMRDVEEKTFDGILKMFDAMSAMMQGGFEMDEDSDPEEMMNMQMRLQETIAKAMEPAQQASKDASEIVKNSASQIKASLPREYAGSFHRMVLAKMYPGIFPDHTSLERLFAEALRRDDLAGQREAITQLQISYLAEADSINRQLIDSTDALNRKQAGGPFGGNYDFEAHQKHWQLVQEMQIKRGELAQSYDHQLKELIGDDQWSSLAGFRGPSQQELRTTSDDADEIMMASSIEGVAVEMSDVSYGLNDGYLPRAISEDDLNGWLSRLRATDDQRDIIRVLHQDYVAQYHKTAQNEVAAIMKPAQQAFNEESVDPEDMERLNAARMRARTVLRNVDQSFIESVGSLLSSDQLKLFTDVKISRDRAIERSAAFGWEYRATTDPVLLFTRMRPDEAGWSAASKAIAGYEQASIPLLTERAAIVSRRDIINHGSAALYQSGQPDMEALQEHQRKWMAVESEINAVDTKLASLSERATEDIAAALPFDLAERFRDQVRRATYPEVYPDPADATPVLERALALRELTDSQRARIEVLRADHERAHREFSDVLIEFVKADREMRFDNAARMMEGDEAESWMERMNKQEQARYDRMELSATTLRELRTLLTAEQCDRVPGLSLKEE